MKKMDEITALAIVFGNIRRKKRRENLVRVARAFDFLVKLHGSQRAVSEKVGLSSEMIRQFLTVLELCPKVQQMFLKREIDSVDVAKELFVLKDVGKQLDAARAIAGMSSKEARDTRRLSRENQTPIEKAKQTVLQAKGKNVHIFMVDFDRDTHEKILRVAQLSKKAPAELIRKIVIDWLIKKEKKKFEGGRKT